MVSAASLVERMVEGMVEELNWEQVFARERIRSCKELEEGSVVCVWSISNETWVYGKVQGVTADYVEVFYEVAGDICQKRVPKFSDALLPSRIEGGWLLNETNAYKEKMSQLWLANRAKQATD